MPRAVHISACVVLLLVALASSDGPQEPGITIHITGPVKVIRGYPGDAITTQERRHEGATAEQCGDEGGFCVATGNRCNGTIKNIHNSCNDQCSCCVPEKQGCPVGFFMSKGSDQCFKFFNDEERYWDEANSKCNSEGLVLARPSDAVAVNLRKDLLDTYGHGSVWVGGRGDGAKMVWQQDGTEFRQDSSLCHPWACGSSSSTAGTDRCLTLAVYKSSWRDHPGQPYGPQPCTTYPFFTLCEQLIV